jgi:glutamyl-tRNA reductase
MYLFTTKEQVDAHFQYAFFKAINPTLDAHKIEEAVVLYEGERAIRHLFQVAASTDSMVVGEREILRQLREAYNTSKEWEFTNDDIRLLIDTAVLASKDVYSNTKIGEKPVSIASLAVQKVLESQLSKKARIVMVGAGQTNLLVSKLLLKYNYQNVTVFNRSLDKAQQLADMVHGKALLLSSLPSYQEGFDCLIVCTGATEPVVTQELYPGLLNGEEGRKLVIDLSIPNNVDKSILKNHDLYYVEVEDLRSLAQQNLSFRQAEVEKVHEILESYLERFPLQYQQRQIELALKSIPKEIKAIKEHAINNVFNEQIKALDEQSRTLVLAIMDYMEKKCVSIPMKAAKEAIIPS